MIIITHYFDWQDTFTEYCISKQFDSELFDFTVDKRTGSYFQLCLSMTTLHPLRFMFNFYLSSHSQSPSHSRYHEHLVLLPTFFYLSIWSSENVNGHEQSHPHRRYNCIGHHWKALNERQFMTFLTSISQV